jgi:hypothetical protein
MENPMRRFLPTFAATLIKVTSNPCAGAQDEKPKETIKPSNMNMMRGRSDPKLFGKGHAFPDQIFVELMVTVPGRELLRVDEKSKLTAFADDKGNSLIDSKDHRTRFNGSIISLDRASMLVVVMGYRVPAEGAVKVHVKGDLVLAYGLDTMTAEANVDLNAKGDQKVGELKLTLDPLKKVPNGYYFDLVGEARAIKSITAITADGKELYTPAAYTVPTNPGPRIFTFHAPKTNPEFKLKVVYYNKEEKITTPVDLSFGIGL